MKAEDGVLNQRSDGEVVKEVSENLPNVRGAVFPETLVVKAVDLGDLSRLVISSQDGDSLRISDLHCHQVTDGFDRVVASVDVISHEKVVCVRTRAPNLEELHQVVELPVDVTTDGDRDVDRLHVLFVFHNLNGHVAQLFDAVFAERLALAQLLHPALQRVDLCLWVDRGDRDVVQVRCAVYQLRRLWGLLCVLLVNCIFHLYIGV